MRLTALAVAWGKVQLGAAGKKLTTESAKNTEKTKNITTKNTKDTKRISINRREGGKRRGTFRQDQQDIQDEIGKRSAVAKIA